MGRSDMDLNIRIKRFAKNNQAGMALVIAVFLFIVTIIMNPKSMNINTFGSIFAQTMLLSFAAVGQTMVIIGAGLDLSVGAVMSMSAIITTTIMKGQDGSLVIVMLCAVALGSVVGFVNGLCTTKIKLPSLIITLAVSYVVTRLQYVFTGGMPDGVVGKMFAASVQRRFFGIIPSLTFYAVFIWTAAFFLMHKSRFGKQLFLTGDNEEAAKLNGVRTDKIKILAFVFSGIFSAIAGVLGAGYMGSTTCQMFDPYAYNSLVAVIVGGSFGGGVGSYAGSIAGSLLMIVLSNGLTVLDISQPVRNIIMGVVMVLLLSLYNRAKPIRQ